MNAETKLALVVLAILCVGVGMIAYGLGLTTRLASTGTGIALVITALVMFGHLWRTR